ncbi:MAG: hypothetical protein DRN68_08755, partial [Thaumarchaeota archaeon]
EIGLLDDLSENEMASLRAGEGELEYVTRLRNGREVKASKKKLEEILKRKLEKISHTDLAVMLCTGEFDVVSSIPIVHPWRIMASIVKSLNPQKLGVIVPLKSQIDYARRRWSGLAKSLKIISWSPYRSERPRISELSDRQLIVMDCIGYTLKHEEEVRKTVKALILRARTVLGVFLRELNEIIK